jgi:hypothetical protein
VFAVAVITLTYSVTTPYTRSATMVTFSVVIEGMALGGCADQIYCTVKYSLCQEIVGCFGPWAFGIWSGKQRALEYEELVD